MLTASTITAAEARKNRAWLERELRRDLKQKERARLRELRAGLVGVKRRRALWKKAASNRYKKLRATARARHRELRSRVLAALRRRIDRERLELREAHVQRRARIAAEFTDLLERQQKMLEVAKQEQKELRKLEAHGRAAMKPRRTAAEARAESDDLVRNNLTPEEVVIFDKVRSRIKATARMSRTEVFAKWLHDNPDEAAGILYGAAEWKPGELEAAAAEYERERYEQAGGKRIKGKVRKHAETFLGNGKEAETLEEYLSAVPF